MQGRLNEETEVFEILVEHKWIELTDFNWHLVKKEISLDFLVELCYKTIGNFKDCALCELKRRITHDFNLNSLWIFATEARRSLGDLALNEIFDQSGDLYELPPELNR